MKPQAASRARDPHPLAETLERVLNRGVIVERGSAEFDDEWPGVSGDWPWAGRSWADATDVTDDADPPLKTVYGRHHSRSSEDGHRSK